MTSQKTVSKALGNKRGNVLSKGAFIHVSHLSKRYGKLLALDDVLISIPAGETVGILGPNGAGKTTLISIISASRHPSSGSVSIDDINVQKHQRQIRRRIGRVFQDSSLDRELTVRENLLLHGALFEMSGIGLHHAVDKALQNFGLEDVADIQAKSLSGGMRKRVEIAKCVIHNPDIFFLDEPTVGLDTEIRLDVWNLIRRVGKNEHKTIIVASHYLHEIEELCDRVIILYKGRIVINDLVSNLKSSEPSRITVSFTGNATKQIVEQVIGRSVTKIGSSYTFSAKDIPLITDLVHKFEERGLIIRSIERRSVTLEELYLKVIGEQNG